MNKDLTTGKPEKVLWQFCLPLFGSIIFQQLYNIADSFVAGKFISDNALAAVGNSYEITLIFIAFAFGSFLEGTAGFGTPVAITAAMLAGLGFNPWRRCFSARSSIMTSRRRSTRRSFPAA